MFVFDSLLLLFFCLQASFPTFFYFCGREGKELGRWLVGVYSAMGLDLVKEEKRFGVFCFFFLLSVWRNLDSHSVPVFRSEWL